MGPFQFKDLAALLQYMGCRALQDPSCAFGHFVVKLLQASARSTAIPTGGYL